MNASLVRRLLAEFVGTALLVLFGCGSVVAALTLNRGVLDYAGLGIIAIGFGLAVALAIYVVGTTSGAHINPAVTLALAAVRRFKWTEVVPYIVAQAAGATAGALLIVAYVGKRATDSGIGLTNLAAGVNNGQGVVAEGVGTFLLMLTIMAVAVDKRAPAGWAGFLIGIAVLVEITVIGPFTGGSVNPARTFGPYLINDLYGGSTPWSHLWIYIVGPVAGAAAASVAYELLVQPGLVPPVGAPAEPETPKAAAAAADVTVPQTRQPTQDTEVSPPQKPHTS